ncbi:hypothetical protein VNO80_02162 [Phaseolus coccineus]|uniref:Uncharacterized protein n=1 Tax=Phaseolus coccineus TaxID=3886 RepID=A0AAN9RL77_PHACN
MPTFIHRLLAKQARQSNYNYDSKDCAMGCPAAQTVFKPPVCDIGLKNVAAGEIKFHWLYLGVSTFLSLHCSSLPLLPRLNRSNL